MKFLVLLLILFTSCANGEKSLEVERGNTRYGGYLAFASVSDPKSFNPVLAVLFILLSITLAKLSTEKSRSLMERVPEENTAEQSQ